MKNELELTEENLEKWLVENGPFERPKCYAIRFQQKLFASRNADILSTTLSPPTVDNLCAEWINDQG